MKALMIVVPILLIGGAFGAAYTGVINIPGVTPKKVEKKKPAEGEQTEQKSATLETEQGQVSGQDIDTQSQEEETASGIPEAQPPTGPKLDAEQGAKSLAKVWDEIEVNKLIPITESYKEAELALVLFYMDKQKVAQLMGSIDAERAAKLSRELQKLASVVKEEAQ